MKKDKESRNSEATEQAKEETAAKTAAAPDKKKRPRGKVKQLQEQIELLEKEKAELKDKYLRLAAEFENFKKLMTREIENRVQATQEGLILGILPVLDDLERTLAAVDKNDDSPIVAGVKMIHNNMLQILKQFGLEPIEAVGREFDVDVHEALMMVSDKNLPPDVVVQEHQKGYKLNGKVIRHAKVAVNNPESIEQE